MNAREVQAHTPAQPIEHRTAGQLFCPHALLPSGWASDVLLRWDTEGRLTLVQPATPTEMRPGVPEASGPVIAGLPNLHSHAFQRVFAGLTEKRGSNPGQSQDNFWSWRNLMYRMAAHITPEQLQAIATALYVEMLEAGYTSVCEFHYLHHAPGGQPYADRATLSQALLAAAHETGMGLTLLPVLYQTSGFGAQPPTQGQQRFVQRTEDMLRLLADLQEPCRAQGVRLGLAPHSLRAVPPENLREALAGLNQLDPTAPIHIHIAEQTAEVEACLAHNGQRPVEWLLDHAEVNARWCLVHATHMSEAEHRRAAQSGAVAGLCPSTEANLGDGIFDAPLWRAHGGAWGLGSDSHVTVDAAQECLLLEYSQRLARRERNVCASVEHPNVGTALWLEAVAGGAQAAARPVAGLQVGQQADWVELDNQHLALAGLQDPAEQLDAHIFASSRTRTVARVGVAGRLRVNEGRHVMQASSQAALVAARQALLRASS